MVILKSLLSWLLWMNPVNSSNSALFILNHNGFYILSDFSSVCSDSFSLNNGAKSLLKPNELDNWYTIWVILFWKVVLCFFLSCVHSDTPSFNLSMASSFLTLLLLMPVFIFFAYCHFIHVNSDIINQSLCFVKVIFWFQPFW